MNLILFKKLNTCTISCGSFKVLWFGSRDSVHGGFEVRNFLAVIIQVIVFIISLFINEIVYKLSHEEVFNEYKFILGRIAFPLPSLECYFCCIFLFILLGALISKSYFMCCLNTCCFIQSFSYISIKPLYILTRMLNI